MARKSIKIPETIYKENRFGEYSPRPASAVYKNNREICFAIENLFESCGVYVNVDYTFPELSIKLSGTNKEYKIYTGGGPKLMYIADRPKNPTERLYLRYGRTIQISDVKSKLRKIVQRCIDYQNMKYLKENTIKKSKSIAGFIKDKVEDELGEKYGIYVKSKYAVEVPHVIDVDVLDKDTDSIILKFTYNNVSKLISPESIKVPRYEPELSETVGILPIDQYRLKLSKRLDRLQEILLSVIRLINGYNES